MTKEKLIARIAQEIVGQFKPTELAHVAEHPILADVGFYTLYENRGFTRIYDVVYTSLSTIPSNIGILGNELSIVFEDEDCKRLEAAVIRAVKRAYRVNNVKTNLKKKTK